MVKSVLFALFLYTVQSVLATDLTLSDSLSPERSPYDPDPSWPNQFTSNFVVLVEKYGPEWNSTGVIYYDWTIKVSM